MTTVIDKLIGWYQRRKGKVSYIEVEDRGFNPTIELIVTLKQQIKNQGQELEAKNIVIEHLRRENLTLRDKISGAKDIITTALNPSKHFLTVSALTAELERRDREKAINAKKDPTN